MYLHTVSAHNRFPGVLTIGMPTGIEWRVVRSLPNTVVLQAAIDVVGAFVVCIYIVKLPYSRGVVLHPMGAAVISNINPPVVPIDHMLWVPWVYPYVVVV